MTDIKKNPGPIEKAGNQAQVPATGPERKAPLTLSDATMKQLMFGWAQKPFIAMLPGTDDKEKERIFNLEAYYALSIIEKSDALQTCDRKSIIDSVVAVASTGLTLAPEMRLGYLIPRKGKCYFQSSYMGKRELMIRTGLVKDIWANIVYSKETFIEKGGTEHTIEHRTVPFGDKGEIVGGYWAAELANGSRPYGIMEIERIRVIQSRSEAVKSGRGTPWDTDEEEMIKKTLINNSWKHLPKTGISPNVLKAMEADNAFDNDEFEDWLKKKEIEAGSDWEKDEKAAGKSNNIHVQDATIVTEPEKKPEPPKAQEEVPPPESNDQGGDLSNLGSEQKGKNLL
jgi:recombination protein RecT